MDFKHHEPEILLFASDGEALNARHQETMRYWLEEPFPGDSSVTVVIAVNENDDGVMP